MYNSDVTRRKERRTRDGRGLAPGGVFRFRWVRGPGPAGKDRCDRCDHGRIYRCRGAREVAVYCRSLRAQISADIAECSAFRAATALTLSDMMDIALTIDPREGIDGRSYR